ncbi:inactive protein RESTRICTED TEV MOVEMENT 2-like [Gastrolobium bilobum]|uniref:inactive protein RESTRICTED TEV MOVEMENT 2-like n=1 Tax=Gastrolobium bilobum TaxID=150636 RepID=UPI002AB22CF3|nr:inactive protein RESTRICTED TEV MOVEMENT 2-like [Gastrolobium bilobum]
MSLDQKTRVQPQADRVYEDFEPSFNWDHDEGSATLIVMLPGFRKEQLKVQISSTRILKVSGERKINENKWRRFLKELPVPPNSDTSGISAKFDDGKLYVRIPKVITPIKSQAAATTPTQEAPKPQQPTTKKPNARDVDQQKPVEKTEAQTPFKEPKGDEDFQKKPQNKEKGKVETDAKERAEATTSEEAIIDKRSPTLELLSRQTQEYKNALSGLVEEVKKQMKLANFLVLIFFVLVFGLFLKNAIKSSFGGPKKEL